MSSVQPSTMVNDVQLRFLCPEDIHTVKKLCSDWFPIEYPDSWYEEITSNPKFFSLAATYHSNIIGLIVSEVKSRNKIHKEDRTVLASSYPDNTQVAYILSLGVVQEYRQHGIASLLLETLLSHLTTSERHNVKAVYLHVLTTNTTAIRFYEHRSFRRHNYLPYYYAIKGVPKDGFSYVLDCSVDSVQQSGVSYPSCTLLIGKPTGPVTPCELYRPACYSMGTVQAYNTM
ncbi:N-alpha-acetyltransferase 60 [Branchiostoma belcheri]|nr:N-alpha-acetyltransferase 60 [Branchiostoma belcheri]